MVLFETVNALAEALSRSPNAMASIRRCCSIPCRGFGRYSFALRNHGLKAIVPGNFPERAFSTEYALGQGSARPMRCNWPRQQAGIRIRGAELIGQALWSN